MKTPFRYKKCESYLNWTQQDRFNLRHRCPFIAIGWCLSTSWRFSVCTALVYACVCCSLASVFRWRASPVQLLGLARVVANAHTNVASPGCAIAPAIYELSVPSLPSGCAMCEWINLFACRLLNSLSDLKSFYGYCNLKRCKKKKWKKTHT